VKSSHGWQEEHEKPVGSLEYAAFDAMSVVAGCQPAEIEHNYSSKLMQENQINSIQVTA
jgi:hypothetical protein